jgi:hypothetical protein
MLHSRFSLLLDASGIDSIAMYPMKKALDNPKGNEPSHVNTREHITVLAIPGSHTQSLTKDGIKLHNSNTTDYLFVAMLSSIDAKALLTYLAHSRCMSTSLAMVSSNSAVGA